MNCLFGTPASSTHMVGQWSTPPVPTKPVSYYHKFLNSVTYSRMGFSFEVFFAIPFIKFFFTSIF